MSIKDAKEASCLASEVLFNHMAVLQIKAMLKRVTPRLQISDGNPPRQARCFSLSPVRGDVAGGSGKIGAGVEDQQKIYQKWLSSIKP